MKKGKTILATTMEKLTHYWITDYDWRKFEAKVTSLPGKCRILLTSALAPK